MIDYSQLQEDLVLLVGELILHKNRMAQGNLTHVTSDDVLQHLGVGPLQSVEQEKTLVYNVFRAEVLGTTARICNLIQECEKRS